MIPQNVTDYLAKPWSINDAPPEFRDTPHAGDNPIPADATEYMREMILRLNAYERSFMAFWIQQPNGKEYIADHYARHDSGLTENGLLTARVYAGKKASWKPGVFIPIKFYATPTRET